MSKSAINSLLKTRSALHTKLKTLDEKRKPLDNELQRIDGALKALGHAENTDAAQESPPAKPPEQPADHSSPQTPASEDDAKDVTVPDFMVRGAKNLTA